jgi:hypothetical protein
MWHLIRVSALGFAEKFICQQIEHMRLPLHLNATLLCVVLSGMGQYAKLWSL